VLAVAVLILALVTVPFGRILLAPVPAFLPLVIGSSMVVLVLTGVILFVQHRIARDSRVGMMAAAYGFAAAGQALYLVTFPGVFTPEGLLSADTTTASWWFTLTPVLFACYLMLAVNLRTTASPRWWFRRTALVTLVLLGVLTYVLSNSDTMLPIIVSNGVFTPIWRHVISPSFIAVLAIATVVIAGRLRTVAQVWLGVVVFASAIELLMAAHLGGARYTVGWYLARVNLIIASTTVLAVFLAKISDLILRLAARNTQTAQRVAAGEARYASLANVVPQLIFTTDNDGQIEYVNERWIAYTGYSLEDVSAAGWRAPLDPADEPALRTRWQATLARGKGFSTEVRLRGAAGGTYRWFQLDVGPVIDAHGDIVAWIGTCTDIDATKRLEEREAFLARAGERLGASLDVTATVQAIAALLIPRLAFRSWVALRGEDGRYVLSVVSSVELADEIELRHWNGVPLPPALQDAVARIVEAGDATVISESAAFPDSWVRELPPNSSMIVPLISGESAIGALLLVRAQGDTFDDLDTALVREFARRASLALQHARLYERERTTADALQRAMLPAQLPLLPDLRFSASYSAASESQRVGGDFYDAFQLPDGRIALTIGDVTGHGLEAAVIMGEIRQALRAAAFEAAEPSTVLDRASRLLVASGRSVFVTAIFGVLDMRSGLFTYATAGHPPPLVDEHGVLRRLAGAGLPIGLRGDDGVDFAVRLHAPCTIVLYTDGLMEFARDLDDGQRRIEAAIRELADEGVEHFAGELMKRVLGDDQASDDIAILTVTIDAFVDAAEGEERSWIFSHEDGRTGALARREIGEMIADWTGRDEARYGAELAFGELLANVVRHAPGTVQVLLTADASGTATLTVEDRGTGFLPANGVVDPFAESGRGLALVRAVADDVAIAALGHGGTRVAVTFAAV
jgi:PAS domain S-box-containing protein